MDRKFEVYFCGCGRIQFIPIKRFNEVCLTENGKLTGKEIVRICRGCGAAVRTGLDNYMEGYAYYSIPLENGDIEPTENQVVMVLDGYRIPMCSGGYAEGRRGGLWIDEDALMRETGTGDISEYKEVNLRFGTKSIKNIAAMNVQMSRVLRELDGDHIRSIVGYCYGPSFDWKGTPYERRVAGY